MNEWLKEHLTWVISVVAVVFFGYVEWRVDANVQTAVNEVGSITPEQLALVEQKVEGNADEIDDVRAQYIADRDDLRDRVARMLDILLEE